MQRMRGYRTEEKESIAAIRTVSTVGDAETAIALVPNPIASTVLPSKVVRVSRRV